MEKYQNIPVKYIKQIAKNLKIKTSKKESQEIIQEIIKSNCQKHLDHLNGQFRYKGNNLTICKPSNSFPEKSGTAERFMKSLIKEKHVVNGQIGTEWQPSLKPQIQICSVEQDGSDVYIKLVEEKKSSRKQGYSNIISTYAHYTAIVLHFADQVIELRCAYSDRKKYADYIMKIMGFGQPYDWTPLTVVTKEEAKEICDILSAGLSSTHIAIPSTVGSLVFNGKKGINLRDDRAFVAIKNAIEGIGLSTDDTLDETCFYIYKDDPTGVEIEVSFEVNLKNGGFKFKTDVPEKVVEQVIEAFIYVCYIQKQKALSQAALASSE
ncbi:hypothetical protein [Priestia megaterium]|uniref:hypothetical protein n=1 Tax=Priestia megaterium TaxID=1404 RepID=UPI002E1B69B0|nr:hypothetical protein [Priestia megaterium]